MDTIDPALVAEMMTLLRAERRLVQCDRCGRLALRAHRFRSDKPCYCVACRREKVLEHKRRYAARRRDEERASRQ